MLSTLQHLDFMPSVFSVKLRDRVRLPAAGWPGVSAIVYVFRSHRRRRDMLCLCDDARAWI